MKWVWLISGMAAVGVCVGILSGLLGVGGGILMVPAILHFWPSGAENEVMKRAVATSLAVMVPVSAAGAVRHYMYGNVDLVVTAGLAVGAIIGTIFIGAPLANILPSATLKKIFGVMLIVFGLNMVGALNFLLKR